MSSFVSRNKWKDVLGYDDGIEIRHHPIKTSSTSPSPYPGPWRSSPTSNDPISFPRGLAFFRTTRSDNIVVKSFPHPPPGASKRPPASTKKLFYIAIQRDPNLETELSRPDITLHTGPNKTYPVLSFAKFHSVTQSTDITLYAFHQPSPSSRRIDTSSPSPHPQAPSLRYGSPPARGHGASASLSNLFPKRRHGASASLAGFFPSTKGHAPSASLSSKPSLVLRRDESSGPRMKTERLIPVGGMLRREKYVFHHRITGVLETFEWRTTSSAGGWILPMGIVARPDNGLKLVRTRTKETVAVFSRGMDGGAVPAVLQFIGPGEEEEGLGREFDVLALMSLLSVEERKRRSSGRPWGWQ